MTSATRTSEWRVRVAVYAATELLRVGVEGLLKEAPHLVTAAFDQNHSSPEVDVLVRVVGTEPALAPPDHRGSNNTRHCPTIILLPPEDAGSALVHLLRGARGVLSLDCSRDQLLRAVGVVGAGDYYLAADLADALAAVVATPRLAFDATRRAAVLTERERDVARRLAEGISNRAISTELHLSQATVKFHVSNILRKLNVKTRSEAAAVLAWQPGLHI